MTGADAAGIKRVEACEPLCPSSEDIPLMVFHAFCMSPALPARIGIFLSRVAPEITADNLWRHEEIENPITSSHNGMRNDSDDTLNSHDLFVKGSLYSQRDCREPVGTDQEYRGKRIEG